MLLPPAGTHASAVAGAPVYVRHRPERTLFYQIIEEYLPEFQTHLSQKCIKLPDFVEREFDAYLACGRLEHGAWSRPRRCWSTRSCRSSRCASGC